MRVLSLITAALGLTMGLGSAVEAMPEPRHVPVPKDPTGPRPAKGLVPAPIAARPEMRKAKAQAYGTPRSRPLKERKARRAVRRARAATRRAR